MINDLLFQGTLLVPGTKCVAFDGNVILVVMCLSSLVRAIMCVLAM